MNPGFIKLNRSNDTLELLGDPNAFILLTVIALRARRTDEFNVHNLHSGEALLGDHEKYGLSEQQYRSARKRLARWGFASFKPTTRGTVAKLLGQRIYDINEMLAQQTDNGQTTDCPRTSNARATTNKKEKKEKKEKKYSVHSDEWRLGELLLDGILERKPDFRRPDLQRWADEIDRLLRLDGRGPERIEAVIRWCVQDPFWSNNVLSASQLRKHFDRLELEMAARPAAESLREIMARIEREETP